MKILPSVTALTLMVCKCLRCSPLNGIVGLSRMLLDTPLSGVRSSWLMVEINVVLSRLAFSNDSSWRLRSVISRPKPTKPRWRPSLL
ncbi:Uncharacterised protein [Vibrio cholerae]|nr:Uncharacterised protein [Vibrio cholerae]